MMVSPSIERGIERLIPTVTSTGDESRVAYAQQLRESALLEFRGVVALSETLTGQK